jgi:alpha/beta superfamily hydrolase
VIHPDPCACGMTDEEHMAHALNEALDQALAALRRPYPTSIGRLEGTWDRQSIGRLDDDD